MLKHRHVEGGSKTLPYRGVCIPPFKLQFIDVQNYNREMYCNYLTYVGIMGERNMGKIVFSTQPIIDIYRNGCYHYAE